LIVPEQTITITPLLSIPTKREIDATPRYGLVDSVIGKRAEKISDAQPRTSSSLKGNKPQTGATERE